MISLLRPTLPIALLFLATTTPALEVSLTVEGEPEEIQAVLDFIKSLNAGGEDDPLKINVHSIAAKGETETPETETPALEDPPLSLERPEVFPAKGAPGAPFIVTVNVRDKYDEVDTLSVRLAGTSLSTDLYDDGTQGDKTPGDGIWTATLTPLDVTPSGAYTVEITPYDKNGKALTTLKPDGTVVKLVANTELTIER
ncbi:MAG: hypothetical protein JNK74_18550 [Candidatus Hydrogenedentes bacterium]|nr:hypothetical protein [Candidatus Hydrogenedentota bacterium]